MTYNSSVQTFIESPIFSRQVYDYLDEEEYASFQIYLASVPEAGDLVKDSGGVRKIRWKRKGCGKSAVDSIPGPILKALRKEMEDVD